MPTKRKLIDANKVVQDIRENNQDNFNKRDWTSQDVCTILENAPTVDAVEVVHGRWDVDVGMNYNKERICAICNKRIESNFWHYCPCCGAKMDGDRREQNG